MKTLLNIVVDFIINAINLESILLNFCLTLVDNILFAACRSRTPLFQPHTPEAVALAKVARLGTRREFQTSPCIIRQ